MRLTVLMLCAVWAVTFTARADGTATPVTVTSGFNVGIVADGPGSAADSAGSGIDSLGSVFYDASYATNHDNLGGALAAGQTVTDTNGNSYSLAPASGNDALFIGNGNSSGTLGLSYATNSSLTSLLVLGTSVNGGTILDYTLTFSGGTTVSGTLSFADWHDYGNTGIFTGLGRVNQSDSFAGSASLYAQSINIPAANRMLHLQSISFSYDAGNGNIDGLYPPAAILGISAFNPLILTPDTTPPTLSITAPKNGAKNSNGVYTVTGTANDKVAVFSVQVSVNGGAWTCASTGKNWTNWTAQANLTPGTNTIAAYAVNIGGVPSTTNTVKLVYNEAAGLSVEIDGQGKVTPYDNGAPLVVGSSYHVTAKPDKGWRFWYWGGGVPMSANPTLDFTMSQGLGIVAHFLNVTPPTIAITPPPSGAKYSNPTISVSGKAADLQAVSGVWVQINGGGWVQAAGTTSWRADNLAVVNGPNFVQAYATDEAGNISSTNTVKFMGQLPPTWAPASLAGNLAQLTFNGGYTVTVSCGDNLFCLTDTNLIGDSGIGNYVYDQTDTNLATLQLVNFIAPPGLANISPQGIELTFTNRNAGTFIDTNSSNTGSFSLEHPAALLPANWSGHTLVASSTGGSTPTLVKFNGNTVTISQTGKLTRTGTYVATDASPIGTMIAVTYTDVVDQGDGTYLQLTFTSTKSGVYEANNFANGVSTGSNDAGTFTLY